MNKDAFSKSPLSRLQKTNNNQYKIQQQRKKPKQITGLHMQFQELKKKIRDVQTKNQRIIQKIHNAFNYKKKGVYVQGQSDEDQIYQEYQTQNRYQQPLIMMNYQTMPHPQISKNSISYNSGDSRIQKSIAHSYVSKNYKNAPETGIQNMHATQLSIRSKSPRTPSNNMRQPVYNISQNQLNGKNAHLQALLKIQRNKVADLMTKLQKKQQQHYKLQNIEKKFRVYAQNAKVVIQNQLVTFLQTYVRNNMMGIQKACQNNKTRLIKLIMNFREFNEQRKSNKVIRQHKNRRQSSKSLRKLDRKPSKNDLSKSQVKKDDSTKKNKQFQEIALKYQQIIKTKSLQIDSLQKKIKQKDFQISQFKNKIQQLNKKLRQEQNKNNQLFQSRKVKSLKQSMMDEQLQFKINQQQNLLNEERSKVNILNIRIQQAQLSLTQRDIQISSLNENIKFLENKVSTLNTVQKKSQYANKVVEKLQRQISQKSITIDQLFQKNNVSQKKYMEKQCQLYGITNKLNKIQQILQMKENKIQQLQRLLHNHQEIMDRSLILDQSMTKLDNRHQDFKKLFEDNQKLQEQITTIRNQNYSLVKHKQHFQNKINQLQDKNASLKRQLQLIQQENQIKSFRSSNIENLQELQEDKRKLQQEIQQLSQKCNSHLKNIQVLRNQNLELNSKVMKAMSQLQFVKDSVEQKEGGLQRVKRQNQSLRNRIIDLQKVLSQNQCQLQIEKKSYQLRIEQIENKWKQFEQNMQADQGIDFMEMRSQRTSVKNVQNNYNFLSTQNQLLSEKLKQANAIIQTQNVMEQKILQQYRLNVQKVKTELKQKCLKIQKLQHQVQKSRKRIIHLQARQKQNASNYEQNLLERIEQLQSQLKQTKLLNNQLTDVSNQLFDQMKGKQQQRQDIVKQLQFKTQRIHQLQEILQAKQIPYASRVSNKSKNKEIYKSQISHNNLSQSQSFFPNQGTIDFDLSVQHSFIDNSHLNVSQLFKQMPHDKLKLRKREHKLFEKTASYISSLKQVIQQKNKKIRVLEKKIQSLKASQLIRKDYDFAGKNLQEQHDDIQGMFKDYQSVDFDRKRGTHHKRYKMLEGDTKLIVQENNMLAQQIQSLNEQLQRAEQQQNSLVKIKDLYKDEIKKLIKKNQQSAKAYQEQLAKQRAKIQDSQSIHTFEALKQLFIKILSVALNGENKNRKQQKKLQLEQNIKTVSDLLKIPNSQKEALIQKIKEA